MDTFTQIVTDWHDFYILVGTAAATLIGLLFVGVSLHVNFLRRNEARELLFLGGLTFNSFFYVLLFAFFFLIPEQTSGALGAELFLLGTLGFVSDFIQFRQTRNKIEGWRFALPLASLVVVVLIALSVFAGQTGGFIVLVAVMVVLLASASRNAWDFLIGVTHVDPDAPAADGD
jgi:hypothetical protein